MALGAVMAFADVEEHLHREARQDEVGVRHASDQ